MWTNSWGPAMWIFTKGRIWLVDALPKGPTGKVQKRDITVPTSESAP